MTRTLTASVSVSELAVSERCPREWYYAYSLRLRPRTETRSQARGHAIHAAIAAWHAGAPPLVAADDPYDAARWTAMVATYAATVQRAPTQRAEVPIDAASIGHGVRLHGVVDALDDDVLVERKTTSDDISIGSAYWRRLRLDPQIHLYAHATGRWQVRYEVLRVPAHRPSKDETAEGFGTRVAAAISIEPERYVASADITLRGVDVEAARADAVAVARRIRANAKLGARAPRHTSQCVRHHTLCSYHDVCSGIASIFDAMRFERRAPNEAAKTT